MSDYNISAVQLNAGLDLSTPKMLAEPGSMIDCLNYELVDFLGYRRIDGFSRYDGNVSLNDIPRLQILEGVVNTTSGTTPASVTDEFLEDSFGNIIGWIVTSTQQTVSTSLMKYIMFQGSATVEGTFGAWDFEGTVGDHAEATITQAQLIAFEDALRDEVSPLPYTPIGLHWKDRNLWAIVPYEMVPYEVSVVDEPLEYELDQNLATTFSGVTGVLRGVVVTRAADATHTEVGRLIVDSSSGGSWDEDTNDTDTLSGAVSVASGVVYHQTGYRSGMTSTAAGVWIAQRPGFLNFTKAFAEPGWFQLTRSYTATVTLTTATDEFNTRAKGYSAEEAAYWVDDGVDTRQITMLDYTILSGTFAAGNAVVRIQFSGNVDLTTDFTLYTNETLTDPVADVTTRMSLNYLPGYPDLNEQSSRYLMKSLNFYASEDQEAIYGVNGAGRAFIIHDDGAISHIYTQEDDDLDKPRHLENHAMHLALGFRPGSVQLSVVGEPANFSGLLGATEIGIGDRVTGLMTLAGSTLGVFCEKSIHSIVGSTVDAFDKQVIAPKTGCIEYTLADCGSPVFADSRGITTLETSASYGDFAAGRISGLISSWLVPRLRKGTIGINNYAGVACALPVREKNQYRLFFNDGQILTLTLRPGNTGPGFTWQQYYIEEASVTGNDNRMIPLAWTSEVDAEGKERIFVSHYNEDSPIETPQVFELECGNSFDGNYIPHNFTINWFFGEAPSQFVTTRGLRAHGVSKGVAKLKVQVAGAQNDFFFSGSSLSSNAPPISLPRTDAGIVTDFQPVTNRTDIIGRGLAVQFKFSGSNTTLSAIEPSHAIQVLLIASLPDGAADL